MARNVKTRKASRTKEAGRPARWWASFDGAARFRAARRAAALDRHPACLEEARLRGAPRAVVRALDRDDVRGHEEAGQGSGEVVDVNADRRHPLGSQHHARLQLGVVQRVRAQNRADAGAAQPLQTRSHRRPGDLEGFA